MSQWAETVQSSGDEDHRCATCRQAVDPLRAARVRLFSDGFHYFCSSQCADEYPPDPTAATPLPRDTSRPSPVAAEPVATEQAPAEPLAPMRNRWGTKASAAEKARRTAEREGAAANPAPAAAATPQVSSSRSQEPAEGKRPADKAFPFAAVAGAAAGLGVTLLLAKESQATLLLRAGLTLAGGIALLLERARDPFALSPHNRWFAPVLTCVTAVLAGALATTGSEEAVVATNLGAMLLLASSVSIALLGKFGGPVEVTRRRLESALSEGGPVRKNPLKPGQTIMLHAGDRVLADVTVVSGQAEARGWPDAPVDHAVGPEDNLYAGSRITSGQVQATVRWTGLDTQFARLTLDRRRRADLCAPLVRVARMVGGRGTLVGLFLVGALGITFHLGFVNTTLLAIAIASSFVNPALSAIPAILTTSTVLQAIRLGIAFRSATSLDAAGRVSTVVFCARGTLLLGEPELSSIDTFGKLSQDEVLALVAGTEQGQVSPKSLAVMRATRARKVQPDAVRSPDRHVGLGTTAIASNGSPLAVGSRALMLSRYVSVARAEARITELEAMGREAILVALDGHLVGILALQDGLAAGARAAVQHLLDVNIEPVLLSGDARKTCEALGRTIDIDHVRPEILPADRGQEIARLQSGGAHVAVVGRTPTDDLALIQAGVSIVLPSPGFSASDFDIELADNAVQKASVALALAQTLRHRAQLSLSAMVAGLGVTLVLLMGLSLPLVVAPIVTILSTLAGALVAFAGSRRD